MKWGTMPKMKTHKACEEAVPRHRPGKLKRNKAGKKHLLSHKSGKRKRQLRKGEIQTNPITGKYLRALGQGCSSFATLRRSVFIGSSYP